MPAVLVLAVMIVGGISDQTPVADAVMDGNAVALKNVIAAGADVNAKSSEGRTSLMQAAGDGRVDLVALLLDKGADLAAVDSSGRTAWMYAAMGDHLDVVNIFKKVRP